MIKITKLYPNVEIEKETQFGFQRIILSEPEQLQLFEFLKEEGYT